VQRQTDGMWMQRSIRTRISSSLSFPNSLLPDRISSFRPLCKDAALESLVNDMEEYYEGFDADTEAYLWLDSNGHGKNGAPYRMKDVLADMEAAEGMVSKLLEAVRNLTN
jgi:hypothetical protein